MEDKNTAKMCGKTCVPGHEKLEVQNEKKNVILSFYILFLHYCFGLSHEN